MSPIISCKIYAQSNSEHLQIIYTGFRLLQQQKKINLSFVIGKYQKEHFPDLSPAEVLVELNGTKLIIFDMLDFGNIHNDILDEVDFYFKRSFSTSLINQNQLNKKVFPLGLMYRVEEKYPSWFSINRTRLEKSKLECWKSLYKTLLSPLGSINQSLFRLNISNCSSPPKPSSPGKVIFMARLWDPENTAPKYRDERESINRMRAECVKRLKQEFGDQFIGGLIPNEYACRNFIDCVVQEPRLTIFGNYIPLLQQCSVGIATTGLHNSIGWKFAEYVAFSLAIVSEKLNYEVPGLEPNKHYLEFTTADECLESVTKLMQNEPLRYQMMLANHEFYNNYLRPDQLVWNALSIALGS